MNWTGWQALVLLATAFLSQSAGAAYTQLPTAPPPIPEVTVEADRIPVKQAVAEFVERITRQMDSSDSLARWVAPICPMVAGLPEQAGEFVVQRISDVARLAGAPLAATKCKPNLYILATTQPAALLKAWRRRDSHLFGDAFPTSIEKFSRSTRPIRVWYNDDLIDSIDQAPSIVSVTGGQQYQFQAFKSRGSQLLFSTVLEISSVIIIVDLNQLKGFEIRPIADYIAMVGLMEINLDGDLRHAPSVLHMFSDPTIVGLSAWDQAFLKGLYQTDQSSRLQKTAIKESMTRDVSH
jgi:hypothetical protein